MKTAARFALLLVVLGTSACGGGGDDGPAAPDAGTLPDAAGTLPDAAGRADAGDGWTRIITGEWMLGAGGENTSDLHFTTLDRDFYISAIRPINPIGTHHTVLALDNGVNANIVYASGVNTNALTFPPGVALRLPAGQSLILQLHLFNTSDAAIAGTSGVEVLEMDPADVEHEADLFLPGPVDFNIPPMQEYTHGGTCTSTIDQTVFAIFPHMHQLGTHLKTTLTVGGVERVLHDEPYAFDHQAFIPFEPITLTPGDTVRTECTWNNPTSGAVGWGESSTTEMCFSILYRYTEAALPGIEICNE